MHRISKFVLFTVLRWKIIGDFPREIKQYVVIAAPHTSWMDFPLGILIRSIKKAKINFIGKKILFKNPQGFFFRRLGGFPIDRTHSNNTVDLLVDMFKRNENFKLGISPEGTRKKVQNWKTGYYYVAKKANVPVVKVALDFKNKQVLIDEPYFLTADAEHDMKTIKRFFHGVKGRFSELS